ncbi:MAG: cytochrome b/b6 domain-containing protein, partial [Prolixibacteraceae bacterium]
MENKLYLYPGLIRIWHVLNALLIILLIISGLSMQYSDPVNPFIRFDLAVSLHNIAGFILIFNYMLFIYGNTISKNGRHYRIQLRGLVDRLTSQFRYYTYGVFKNEPAPFPVTKRMKFNPIQQVTYFMTMYVLMPMIFLTGLPMLFSGAFIRQLLGTNAFFITDILHIAIGFFLSLFLIIHVYFCTFGAKPYSNFKSIVTGYHEGG